MAGTLPPPPTARVNKRRSPAADARHRGWRRRRRAHHRCRHYRHQDRTCKLADPAGPHRDVPSKAGQTGGRKPSQQTPKAASQSPPSQAEQRAANHGEGERKPPPRPLPARSAGARPAPNGGAAACGLQCPKHGRRATPNGQHSTQQATYLFRESSCHAPSAQSCESPARPPVLAQASAQSGQTRSSSCATVTGHHNQSSGGSFKRRRKVAASACVRCSDHMERSSRTRRHPRSSRNSRSERRQQGPRASRLAPCSIWHAHSAHARQPDTHDK